MMELKLNKETEDWESVLTDQPDNVKQVFNDLMSEYAKNVLITMNETESPSEALMAIALANEKMRHERAYDVVDIFTQEPIEIDKNSHYRVDFLVVAERKGKVRFLVVECDGHDFHERTKEQATRDKRRDRILMGLGFPVVRLSGTDIFENANDCAVDVFQALIRQFLEPKAERAATYSTIKSLDKRG